MIYYWQGQFLWIKKQPKLGSREPNSRIKVAILNLFDKKRRLDPCFFMKGS